MKFSLVAVEWTLLHVMLFFFAFTAAYFIWFIVVPCGTLTAILATPKRTRSLAMCAVVGCVIWIPIMLTCDQFLR